MRTADIGASLKGKPSCSLIVEDPMPVSSLIRRPPWARTVSAGLLAAMLSACGGSIEIDPVDNRTRLSMNACPVSIADADAQCGTLTVPENRDRADSRLIRLPFVVLPARQAPKAVDPVLVVGGGPGSSVLLALASAPAELLAQHPLRQRRDLIAMDQRGTPLTGPGSLDCPELLRDYAAGERFESDAEVVAAASACQARLRSQDVDLGAYDSRHSARDLEELRQRLGERRGFWQWNVVATSYGTRLALTALQDGSPSVRSLVLDGPLPPQANALYSAGVLDALDQVLHACAARPACNAAYPGLRPRFAQALEQLELLPYPLPGGTAVSGHRLLAVLRTHLAAGAAQHLPLAMELVARGRIDQADALLGLSAWIDRVPPISGMYLSVMCRDESGQAPTVGRLPSEGAGWPAAVRRASAQYGTQTTASICPSWLRGQPRLPLPALVRSAVPTLVTVGQFDPMTPAANAALVREGLPQAHAVVFGGKGHGLLESDWCQLQVAAAFIDRPDRAPDTACVPGPDTTDFIVP
jgi:pimeloyl-ACP methyl ester carboxylesterase